MIKCERNVVSVANICSNALGDGVAAECTKHV